MRQSVDRIARQSEPAARLMTLDRLADVYAISRTVAYELLSEGKIDSVKLGRRRLVKVESVETFIATLDSAPPERSL